MIRGLAGVLVHTTPERFGTMRDFYVRILRLHPRSDRPGFVNFEWDNQRLTIATHSQVDSINPSPLHVMVNLATDDIEGTHAGAVARGARSIREPEQESWGGRVATLLDPDDNVIQLLEMSRE